MSKSKSPDLVDDFTSDLIKSLNKEAGDRVAYNLATDESPTHVKRWISTGSHLLDYIVSNRRDGGLPEGRIVEIFGDPGLGKSHLAAQICRSAQKMGGLAVYIDTENATSPENLQLLGVDIGQRFVYVSEHCTENVMSYAEKTMIKARAMKRDVPVVIVWDSIAGTSPKAELEGEYDDQTVGLQARTISRGMRKITGVIGDNNVLLVCLNQTRTKIGVMYGDPTTVPGGKAVPFHASVRIQLFGGNHIKDSYGDIIGIQVKAKVIKDRVAPPFRRTEFKIIFGLGIDEAEEVFDTLKSAGPTQIGDQIIAVGNFSGDSWKKLMVLPTSEFSIEDFEYDKKKNKYKWPKKALFQKMKMQERATHYNSFYLKDFQDIIDSKDSGPWISSLLEKVMIKKLKGVQEYDVNPDSYVEMQALADEIGEGLIDLDDLE